MVGGLASPGSTVRRLTSVRGFYYDVLESCGVRRNEGPYDSAQLSVESPLRSHLPSAVRPSPDLTLTDFHARSVKRIPGIYYARKKI